MIIIAPSILSGDFSKLGSVIRETARTKAQFIHIDVMDGCFVPNITIGPCVIKSIRPCTAKTFDVHLMIDEPIRYVGEFIKAGADIVTVHAEACKNVGETLKLIRKLGAKACLAIKPKTDPESVVPYISLCDMILVMTVEPGFGGQSFIYSAIENVKSISRILRENHLSVPIEVDGGITTETIGCAANAGAEIFVAGSAVYKKPSVREAVNALYAAAEAAGKTEN